MREVEVALADVLLGRPNKVCLIPKRQAISREKAQANNFWKKMMKKKKKREDIKDSTDRQLRHFSESQSDCRHLPS